MNFSPVAPNGLGALIAIVVLLLCIVFAVIGQLPAQLALLIGGCALARLC